MYGRTGKAKEAELRALAALLEEKAKAKEAELNAKLAPLHQRSSVSGLEVEAAAANPSDRTLTHADNFSWIFPSHVRENRNESFLGGETLVETLGG